MKNTHISKASSIIEKQNESSMVAPKMKVDASPQKSGKPDAGN